MTCSRDGTARLWDVGQKEELYAWTELGGEINCCTLAATDNSVKLGVPDENPSECLLFFAFVSVTFVCIGWRIPRHSRAL